MTRSGDLHQQAAYGGRTQGCRVPGLRPAGSPDRLRRRALLIGCGLLLGTVAGCSSPVQIQTMPPISTVSPDSTAPAALAPLVVLMETGDTPLPDDVQALRFRVTDVHLKAAGGDWTSYPADANAFEIMRTGRLRKPVLTLRVPPVPYDSLALSLADVFVFYDANAGGPLTMPRNRPIRLPLMMHGAEGRRTTLRLVFEPGASLTRTKDCRWFFLPFVDVFVE